LTPADGKGADITLRFPAHSHTPHEKGLMQAVKDAVPALLHDWVAARGQVYLSLPATAPSMSPKWWDGVRIVQAPAAKK
jgi:hypothetical protein